MRRAAIIFAKFSANLKRIRSSHTKLVLSCCVTSFKFYNHFWFHTFINDLRSFPDQFLSAIEQQQQYYSRRHNEIQITRIQQ